MSTIPLKQVSQVALSVVASENISAGSLVNLHVVTGDLRVRNANNTIANNAGRCQGYVLSSVTSGNTAIVYVLWGTQITGLSSLSIGSIYYLGTVGQLTTTPPAQGSNNCFQEIGVAITTTTLLFTPGPAILRS